jgi:hypothetical protein
LFLFKLNLLEIFPLGMAFPNFVNNVGREAAPWLFRLVLWLAFRLGESVFLGSFGSPFRLFQVSKPVHQPSTLA